MKLNITVDCTPEEARAFLGLPDVSSLNETLVASVKERVEQNMDGQVQDSFMNMMSAGARAAAGGAADKDK